MALSAFAGALLALSPTLAAFTATVGASSSLTAGVSPTQPNTPMVPFLQLSLAPMADVLFEGRKTVLQANYSPSFIWMPLPEAKNSGDATFLSHNGELSYTHRTTPRFDSTVRLAGTIGSIPLVQLRNPNSVVFGATQGGTTRMDTVTFNGSAGSRYLFSRLWTYAGNISAQLFQTDMGNGSPPADQQVGVTLSSQRTLMTQHSVDYLLSPGNTLGVNGSVGFTRSDQNDLLSSSIALTHKRQLGVVTQLTLSGGIADYSTLPGSITRSEQERTSGTAAVTFTSEASIGPRRARYEISAQWAPGVDLVLGEVRDRVRLLIGGDAPLTEDMTVGVSVQASTSTDARPTNGNNAGGGGQVGGGPIDETLFYVSVPFTYRVNDEWALNWGGIASWTAPHLRLPFELNNPYYAGYVGVGFRVPVYRTR